MSRDLCAPLKDFECTTDSAEHSVLVLSGCSGAEAFSISPAGLSTGHREVVTMRHWALRYPREKAALCAGEVGAVIHLLQRGLCKNLNLL